MPLEPGQLENRRLEEGAWGLLLARRWKAAMGSGVDMGAGHGGGVGMGASGGDELGEVGTRVSTTRQSKMESSLLFKAV